MSYFIGDTSNFGDDVRWWVGEVVDTKNDPLQQGRALVRIFGIHGPDVRDDQLPWAPVILPVTSAGAGGGGITPNLQDNARVMGIFLDGRISQNPIILGHTVTTDQGLPPAGQGGSPSGTYGILPDAGNLPAGQITGSRFNGTSPEMRETVEERYGPITDQEFRDLVSIIYCEATPDDKERAWVCATIMNRRRANRWFSADTVIGVLSKRFQFQPVTGLSGNGPPLQKFIDGPPESIARQIYGAVTQYLNTAPDNLYNFTSGNPGAYRGTGNDPESVKREWTTGDNALVFVNTIGETMFFIDPRGDG